MVGLYLHSGFNKESLILLSSEGVISVTGTAVSLSRTRLYPHPPVFNTFTPFWAPFCHYINPPILRKHNIAISDESLVLCVLQYICFNSHVSYNFLISHDVSVDASKDSVILRQGSTPSCPVKYFQTFSCSRWNIFSELHGELPTAFEAWHEYLLTAKGWMKHLLWLIKRNKSDENFVSELKCKTTIRENLPLFVVQQSSFCLWKLGCDKITISSKWKAK